MGELVRTQTPSWSCKINGQQPKLHIYYGFIMHQGERTTFMALLGAVGHTRIFGLSQ